MKSQLLRVPPHIRAHAQEVAPAHGMTASKLIQRWLKIGFDEYLRASELLAPKRR